MSPQSLYLCGVSEVRVEMKVAPFRALTHPCFVLNNIVRAVEMKVAPFRALTQPNGISRYTSGLVVEMRVAPFRAFARSQG